MTEPEELGKPPAALAYGELPELTRALRALGSARRSAGPLQSVFFRPLLDARRKAADARDARGMVRAFDAAALGHSLDACLDRIVAQWPDPRDSARRAIHAQLSERLIAYRGALARLGEAGTRVAAGSDGDVGAWREWTTALQAVFETADRSWMAIQSVVDALTAKGRG